MSRMTEGLIDEKDRRRASGELKTTFLVEAGAGTGKTAVLVSRIVNYLSSEDGRSASLAAITFTENAAAELKTRIRDGLEAHWQVVARTEAGSRVADNLARLDQAFIGTIHSFCAHLLKRRPVEADLDPAFGVADEMESFFLFEDLWTEWMGRHLAERPAVFMAAMDYGISLEKIKSIADRLVENMDLWPEWKSRRPSTTAAACTSGSTHSPV